MEFHAETGIDAAYLEEAAAERTTRELRFAPLGKKLPAAQTHDAARRVHDDEFVQIVMSDNCESLKHRQFVNLTTVGPFSVCPVIEDRCGGHRRYR